MTSVPDRGGDSRRVFSPIADVEGPFTAIHRSSDGGVVHSEGHKTHADAAAWLKEATLSGTGTSVDAGVDGSGKPFGAKVAVSHGIVKGATGVRTTHTMMVRGRSAGDKDVTFSVQDHGAAGPTVHDHRNPYGVGAFFR